MAITLQQQIDEIESTIQGLDTVERKDTIPLGEKMYRGFFSLALLVWRDPPLRQSHIVTEFVKRMEKQIEYAIVLAGAFYVEITHLLVAEHLGDYSPEDICCFYSGGRFIYELFAGANEDEIFETSTSFSVKDEYLEELKNTLARSGGVHGVPEGVPKEHFWWWTEAAPEPDSFSY